MRRVMVRGVMSREVSRTGGLLATTEWLPHSGRGHDHDSFSLSLSVFFLSFFSYIFFCSLFPSFSHSFFPSLLYLSVAYSIRSSLFRPLPFLFLHLSFYTSPSLHSSMSQAPKTARCLSDLAHLRKSRRLYSVDLAAKEIHDDLSQGDGVSAGGSGN